MPVYIKTRIFIPLINCDKCYCKEENCVKRHPVICRYFSLNGSCKYNESCAYAHRESEAQTEIKTVKERLAKSELKVEELEKKLLDMNNILQGLLTNKDTVAVTETKFDGIEEKDV